MSAMIKTINYVDASSGIWCPRRPDHISLNKSLYRKLMMPTTSNDWKDRMPVVSAGCTTAKELSQIVNHIVVGCRVESLVAFKSRRQNVVFLTVRDRDCFIRS